MLSEEIKKLIGISSSVRTYEVEKGAIRRFAEAMDDPNPLYQDEAYAGKSRYGSIIAPPGFFGWPSKQARGNALAIDIPPELLSALEQAGYPKSSVLDGGMEWEFSLPVHAGDILSARTIVRNLRSRTTDTGSVIFSFIETTYHNQTGTLVATQQAMYIHHSGASPQKESTNV
jgi:acyl dehydratase